MSASNGDKDITAAVCRSTPNGLNDLTGKIGQCTTTTESNRNLNLATNSFKLEQDITSLKGMVGDLLTSGDSIFGQAGHIEVVNQVKQRNDDLKSKKDSLLKDVDKNEAIIERSNRDFSDVKDSLPEKQPTRFLHFIEDYTLAILLMAYLFMIIAVIYVYTITSEFKLVGFGKAFIGSIFLTMFLFMLLFYLS
jgi:hypothetical protein